ncbi:MAG TPA: hypothetical protein VFE14_21000 [Micromonosporaceae bacterium]|nr:hypothetical protein [Micromonosporaceae bacterium]
MNPRFVWPAVVLATIAMATVCVMAVAGVERETIVLATSLLVTPILGAMIAGQVSEVRGHTQQVVEQTNGQMNRLLSLVERQGEMLAATMPAPSTVDSADATNDLRTG